jgi:hypothetical protein
MDVWRHAAGALDRDTFIDLAVRALGINYRFGWNEQEQLGLIGNDNYLTILAAAVDLPAFNATVEAQKKSSGPQTERVFRLGRRPNRRLRTQLRRSPAPSPRLRLSG